MKNLVFKICILFMFSTHLSAQEYKKVWEGNLYPKDFDNFQQGIYTKIQGDLMVYNTSQNDLSQLKSLREIDGNMYIGIYDYKKKLDEGNKLLTSLNGLDNLKKVSGKIEIRKNKLLKDITALKGVKNVIKLNISYNPMLQSLEGLNNLSGYLPQGLQLYKNKRLQDISQLSGITLVGDHLAVNSNLSLQNLEGLHNIKAVEKGYLAVRSNSYLKNLNGLRKISTVDEEVQITTNPLLKTLEGLKKLKSIGRFLSIEENEQLENLKGLISLVSIGKDFNIVKNNALKNLDGANNLTTIKGSLLIKKNPSLMDLYGLNQLKDTIESIYIMTNKSLKKITGFNNIDYVTESVLFAHNHTELLTDFDNLKTIGGNLTINDDDFKIVDGFSKLTEVRSFGIGGKIDVLDLSDSFIKLTHIKKGFYFYSTGIQHFIGMNAILEMGDLSINENEKLISFSGFNGLKSIKGKFKIADNKQLQTIYGFKNLETIKKIEIDDNSVLESITGFKNIKHISYIWIDKNKSLNNLTGFSNLISVDNLYLRNNDSLKDLTGFKNLQKVTKELDIHDHSNLVSLKGLENLLFVGEMLDITYNYNLINYNALQDVLIKSTKKSIYKNAYNPNENELLIHDCLDTKVIPESYLKSKNRWLLSLLRNEIFARKGFVFGKGELTDFFTKKGWYKPIEGVEIILNDIEEENVRLIKKYERIQIDFVTNAVVKLKEKYKHNIDFYSDFEKYYPALKDFIKDIDIKRLKKSNKLSYSKEYDFDKNITSENVSELDRISIYFDNKKDIILISIEDNHLQKDNYDTWMINDNIIFEFKIKQDSTIKFERANKKYE